MSPDAYRGNEEAARARLAELKVDREKRLAHFAALGMPMPSRKKKIDQQLAAPDPVRSVASILVALVIAAAAFTGHAVEAGIFAGLLFALNMNNLPYFFRLAQRAVSQIPTIPHVSEFKDPEPVDPLENKPVQRVPTAEEARAKELELEICRIAYEEIEAEIAETEELIARDVAEAEKENHR